MKAGFSVLVLAFISSLFIGCSQLEEGNYSRRSYRRDFGKLNAQAPRETAQYGQLAGEWECVITGYNNDSIISQTTAKWVFRFVLNGYAIQDFWTNPAKISETGQPQIFGTNIRIYNPQLELWQCVWMENQVNAISGIWLSHMNEEGRLLLYDDSKSWQIEFYNITDNSFDWKWNVKQPDGHMKTTVTIKATRV